MTRRSDGKITFGLKEWLGIGGLLVAIALAWGKMDATIAATESASRQRFKSVEDRFDRFESRTQKDLDEIKAELRQRHRDP